MLREPSRIITTAQNLSPTVILHFPELPLPSTCTVTTPTPPLLHPAVGATARYPVHHLPPFLFSPSPPQSKSPQPAKGPGPPPTSSAQPPSSPPSPTPNGSTPRGRGTSAPATSTSTRAPVAIAIGWRVRHVVGQRLHVVAAAL